eukprot:s462_g50.t1
MPVPGGLREGVVTIVQKCYRSSLSRQHVQPCYRVACAEKDRGTSAKFLAAPVTTVSQSGHAKKGERTGSTL